MERPTHAGFTGATDSKSEIALAAGMHPYDIQIVPVDRGWILEKIASQIADLAATSPGRFNVSVTTRPSDNSDLTFFLPESAWRDELEKTIRVTYFAHKEDHPGAAALFEEVARKSDHCVTSSEKYAEALRNCGARSIFTIPLGVDTGTFVPKIRIGVVGRTYHTGRKGESLLAASMDLPFVEFVFTGAGWPLPARHYSERDLAELYQSIDYLLIPSLIEGGPVPMLEALSAGCQVIAPSDVGMVKEYPHIPYRLGDAEDLRRVIQTEVDRRLALRAAVAPCDWLHFARRHLDLFARLIERKRALDMAAPMSNPRHTDNRRCRALLLTHGIESESKGGPTTRVANIVTHLRGRHLPVEAADNLRAIATDRYDVIHVFNSWPLESALKALTAARRSGAMVVFSPIALDLSNWPLFQPFMERLFQSASDLSEIVATAAQIRAVTPRGVYGDPGTGGAPVEGIPGHFEKLRLCCDLADKLVFLSEFEQRFLAAIGAHVDHGVLIRNGVDTDRMSTADPESFRRKYGLERYVLCVGRQEYRKNQALAALALRDAGVEFVCVGAVADAGYVNHVRRLGGRNVRVIDRIDDREMLASAYAGAEAFLFPSWTEGAPLAAMEAGATGVPLILSEMSSEREYFGDDAVYVHPADVNGIRAAVTRLLERPSSAAERRARSLRIAGATSIQHHAEESWSLYERMVADRPPCVRRRPVVMDLSALLHFFRIRQPLTGVPTVESNLLAELVNLDPTLRCIVYNNVKDRYIEIAHEVLRNFDEGAFNSTYWFNVDEPAGTDHTAMLLFTDHGNLQSAYTTSTAAPQGRQHWHSRMFTATKELLEGLPPVIRAPAVALLRRMRAHLRRSGAPFENRGHGHECDFMPAAASTGSGEAAGWQRSAFRLFDHRLGTVLVREAPRHASVVPVGARLLTLGQAWVSNSPLLGALLQLTETRALSLEPYVYDLSYHTGAHLTGWTDNGERFGRLLKLLEHSTRVFTESRQVENELQKLRLSRGLEFSTRRTGLRGRSWPKADRRSAPRHAPGTYVLVVSSFNKRKNHDFLVRVWRELYQTWIKPERRAFRLVLVGEVQEERKYGDPAFLAELRRTNIDVHPMLSDAALAYLMYNCAFTAYPSFQEGWGLPAQESLMCGKVCLVSDSLPVAQEIANVGLIRIAPMDFYGWYEALKTWLSNPSMRSAFSARTREYVPPTWREIAETIYG